MVSNWDVIVVGLGGVGSSAAYHLAKSGLRVLGLDQFPPVHDRGSSHGQTRAIRQAYFEHPAYVPMLRRAYELWDELERVSRQNLFHRTGIVQIGPADGVVVPGVLRSAAEHDLEVDEISMGDVTSRWPMMQGDARWRAVIETNAGFLRVENCVAAHLDLATQFGAKLRHGERVIGWKACGSHVEIQTETGVENAAHVILAAGAWSGQVLSDLGVNLKVLRKHQYWFAPQKREYDLESGFPCFFYETPAGYFYGFPSLGAEGVKVSRHSGGQPVDLPDSTKSNETESNETVSDDDTEDTALVSAFNATHLLRLATQPEHQSGCYYTVTPDDHFVIDRHPTHPSVSIIAGLSGHGFKFTSVLGEIAAGFVHNNDNSLNDLFGLKRLL